MQTGICPREGKPFKRPKVDGFVKIFMGKVCTGKDSDSYCARAPACRQLLITAPRALQNEAYFHVRLNDEA